jgi:hypothetical protein
VIATTVSGPCRIFVVRASGCGPKYLLKGHLAEINMAVANKVLDRIETGTEKVSRYSAAKQAGINRAARQVVKTSQTSQTSLPGLSAKQCQKVIDLAGLDKVVKFKLDNQKPKGISRLDSDYRRFP